MSQSQSRNDLKQPHQSVNSQIKILSWTPQPVDSNLRCSVPSLAYALLHGFLHKVCPYQRGST